MQSQTPIPDLTISIVTYNSRDVIRECLAALPSGTATRLYDNASTDGTVALVRKEFPHVTVTAGTENIGFGRAHNENLRHVTTPFALVLNPDCFPDGEALLALTSILRHHPDAAIAGPGFDTPDSDNDLKNSRLPTEDPVDNEFISGACMLLRLSAFKELGLFDPNLFLFFEDTDLCTKARLSGLRLLLEPRIRVRHLVGRSTPPGSRITMRRDFHIGWSEAYYNCKYRGSRSVLRSKLRVITRHSRKVLQRMIRLSPKTIESASRVCGAVAYACSGPVALPAPDNARPQPRDLVDSQVGDLLTDTPGYRPQPQQSAAGRCRLRYMVNSNYRFYHTSLATLLPSLRACGIDPAHIHVAVGGAPQQGIEWFDGVACHLVPYDSIDFTGLITILHKDLDADYWFYLHDTIRVGRKFRDRLERKLHAFTDAGPVDTIGLRQHASMNIGIYRHQYLLDQRERLLALTNYELGNTALQQCKAWGVEHEDYLLGPIRHSFTRLREQDFIVLGESDYYGTGSNRRVEYYPCLDLHKIKANWDLQTRYGLKL